MARFLAGLVAAAWLFMPALAVAENVAVVLTIGDAIGPATAEYVHDGLAQARARDAQVVVLRIDTPGGLSSSMRGIIHDILESPVPVIAYVSPSGARAASAGTYILYASHLAAMAPSTHLGAATPVTLGGGGLLGGSKDEEKKDAKTPTDAEGRKVLNDAVAYIRGLAQLRGRNIEFAEKAVREAATLTASEARDQHVIELIADNVSDLLKQTDGRTVTIDKKPVTLKTKDLGVVTIEPDWRVRLLAIITNPNIAYLLLLAGIYGIMFEFFSPGAYFPGVLGSISLLVGLYALNLLPINYAGAGLLLLGIGMMVAEAYLPTFGAVGIGGIVAFVLGSLFLFRGEVPGYQLSWQVVTGAAIGSAAFLLIAIAAVWRAHRRMVVTGDTLLIGQEAQVLRWDGKEGDVQVAGERWHAISGAPLAAGQRVRVVDRQRLTLTVAPVST